MMPDNIFIDTSGWSYPDVEAPGAAIFRQLRKDDDTFTHFETAEKVPFRPLQ
jgi:hypothetical protein